MSSIDDRGATRGAEVKELLELVTNYTGPITKVPVGKRTTKKPRQESMGPRFYVDLPADADNMIWGIR